MSGAGLNLARATANAARRSTNSRGFRALPWQKEATPLTAAERTGVGVAAGAIAFSSAWFVYSQLCDPVIGIVRRDVDALIVSTGAGAKE